MRPHGSVRLATVEDAVFIAPILREADRQECIAALGKTPEQFLPGSVAMSDMTFALCAEDGHCIGLFGVSTVPGFDGIVGSVWMVATNDLLPYARQFLREGAPWIDRLHERCPVLVNFVDARNTVHIRWIEWSGFTLLDTREQYGAAGIPFISFAKVKS